MAGFKEVADVYFKVATGLDPSSIGELYRSLPGLGKIVVPVAFSILPLLAGYASKRAYVARNKPQESQSFE